MKRVIVSVLAIFLAGFVAIGGDDSLPGEATHDDFDKLFPDLTEREPTPEAKARIQTLIEAEKQTMEELATTLKKSDRIQVFLLDPNIDPYGQSSFPITPYSTYTRIREVADVREEMLPDFIRGLSASLVGSSVGFSAMCHFPMHGIRCFRGRTVIFETSIAWTCNNFYAYDDGGYHWFGFADTNKNSALMALFERVLPLEATYRDPNWSPK